MDAWVGIDTILSKLFQGAMVLGIIGYFYYRERGRRKENQMMLERMTPEQLAEIRRVDAQIEVERKRHKAGNLWFLRVGMAIVGAGCGLLVGLQCFGAGMDSNSEFVPFVTHKIIAATVVGMGLFMFLEFLIELRLRRMEEK